MAQGNNDADLDQLFERLVASRTGNGEPVVQAVVPGDVLASGRDALETFLDTVLVEYAEIEAALDGLREAPQSARTVIEDAVAVVTEEELGDPAALARVLEPLDSDTARFEFLYDMARSTLERLDAYKLSRKPTSTLVDAVRQEEDLHAVRYLVEFLRALQRAADSFEALELPEPHVRDYLRHLYLMNDWMEMRRLVQLLEAAVVSTLGHWHRPIQPLSRPRGSEVFVFGHQVTYDPDTTMSPPP